MENLQPIDKSVREAVDRYLEKNPSAFGGHRFTAIGSLQPTAPTVISGGVGWVQAPMIGKYLAPDVVGGRDNRLVWMEFGDDALVVPDDQIAPNGPVLPVDASMQLHTETVNPHGRKTTIGIEEARIAAANGINLAAIKSEAPRRLVELRKEVETATFFKTVGNYASASHYETLGGTDQFTHDDSEPIAKFRAYISVVRAACGARPNVLGIGYSAMEALSWNKSLRDLLKQANTLGNGIPVTAQVMAILLNLNVVVGETIYREAAGGSTLDVWGDNSFLVYVGGQNLVDPKFAQTGVSPDYPKVVPMQSQAGLEGGQEIRYGDCYKTFSCWKTAAAALFDCVA